MTEQLETRLARLGTRLDRDGEVLEQRAALVPDRPDSTISTPRLLRPDARRPKRMLVVVGAFAAILAIVLAVVAVSTTDDGGHLRKVVPPSEQPLFPDVMEHTGPELFLRPQQVPTGYSLLLATGPTTERTAGGPTGGPTIWQHWVRLDATGTRPVSGFSIGWGPSDPSKAPPLTPGIAAPPGDALDAYRRGATPITLRDHDAYWSPDSKTIAWDQDNQIIVVKAWINSGLGAWPIQLTQAEIEAIAQQIVRGRHGTFQLAHPPTGYRIAAQVPNIASPGINPRRVVYSDGNNHGFAIQLLDNTEVPPGVDLMTPDTQLVKVGKQTAVLRHTLNGGNETACGAIDAFLCSVNLGDRAFTYLQWLEPDSTRISLTAVGLTDHQVLDLGRNLTHISPTDWKKLKDAGATPGCALIAHCTAPDHPPTAG